MNSGASPCDGTLSASLLAAVGAALLLAEEESELTAAVDTDPLALWDFVEGAFCFCPVVLGLLPTVDADFVVFLAAEEAVPAEYFRWIMRAFFSISSTSVNSGGTVTSSVVEGLTSSLTALTRHGLEIESNKRTKKIWVNILKDAGH